MKKRKVNQMETAKGMPSLASRLFSKHGISLLLLCGLSVHATAATIPNVAKTVHNLSADGPGPVKATTESQVCVFCHTPHAATTGIVAPLWNRKLSSATYTTYTSSSIEANAAELAAGPGGSSKLCLSCHDGTMAIGSVNVLNGAADVNISMQGTDNGKISAGYGTNTGFTRNIGVDLTNDHPISFTYDDALAAADGELRPITGNESVVATRTQTHRPQFPLENGKVQCTTCHDPHLWESDSTKGNRKFLRGNRFQQQAPTGSRYATNSDIVCLACHDRGGQAWSNSAHANPRVADEQYHDVAADLRNFPRNLPVWQAACQNCHDTHTVQGARRLLREGTDSVTTPKSGGNAALEQNCYQCHSATGTSALANVATVPNIKSAFELPYRMPISSSDQPSDTEIHDIGTGRGLQRGKDFVEGQSQLGHGNLNNRHAECTDCHNPHRVVKNYTFFGRNGDTSIPDDQGTHKHTDDPNTIHTNIASGVLRGTFGVEPIYGSNSFHNMPTGFEIKRGDPGTSTSTLVSASYVTREYQVCLKCHSNYGYADNNLYPNGNRPRLGDAGGGTPPGTYGLTMFTNQAKEFFAPVSHRGEIGQNRGSEGGAGSAWNANNHRSWHPVMGETGRDITQRNISDASGFNAPWNNGLGTQTMYCSDCHGSNTPENSVIPLGGVDGEVWGPHGSSNPFLLKGTWLQPTKKPADPDFLDNLVCFKCHKKENYAGLDDTGYVSGFSNKNGFLPIMWWQSKDHPGWFASNNAPDFKFKGTEKRANLHNYHAWVLYYAPKDPPICDGSLGGWVPPICSSSTYQPSKTQLRCSWCHAAVPHGWKNKALLVNLNDVGDEAGYPGQSKEAALPMVGFSPLTNPGYTQEPYYYKAMLKVQSFAKSGEWSHFNCASAGKSEADLIANPATGSTSNNNVDLGLAWMKTTCVRVP